MFDSEKDSLDRCLVNGMQPHQSDLITYWKALYLCWPSLA